MIGCHTDYLYHKDAPARSPEIVISFPTHSTSGSIASPWGGLIYVTVSFSKIFVKFEVSICLRSLALDTLALFTR